MPMYDYKCENCGYEDEFLHPSGDKTPKKCPQCGTTTMKPVWSKAPTQLVTIIPSYPGCKRQKAGYVHSHGDRPSEKVQGKGWRKES